MLIYRTSGAAATAISLLTSSAVSSLGLPSKSRLHHIGGSRGFWPLCSGGQTSAKKYHTCPITTPMISSLGIMPWTTKLNSISTHGSHGAVNTSRPRKLSWVSGFRLDHMYTSVEDRGWPRNGMDTKGDRHIKHVVA